MKTEKMSIEIEGFSPILFDRLWELEQSLQDETVSKGAVSHFTFEQFYSNDEEACFLVKKDGRDRDLTIEEIEAIQKDQITKNKVVPAIPIKHWLDGAMFGVAGQVKVAGKKTIKDFINSTFTIVEARCPIGKTEHFFDPEYLDKSLPSNKSGQRHYSEKPGFKDTPIIMFTARADEEDIVRSFESGVNDYINKPAKPSLLRSRVHRWLMHSDQKTEERELNT